MIRCDKTKTVHFLCWMTASTIAITMIFLSRSTTIACVIYYAPLLSRLARNMTDSPWGFASAFDQGLREIEWNWMKFTYLWISQVINNWYGQWIPSHTRWIAMACHSYSMLRLSETKLSEDTQSGSSQVRFWWRRGVFQIEPRIKSGYTCTLW